jgi:hypothetical protein
MRNLKSYFLIAAIAVLFASCGKDGATGPAGPQGEPGNANVNTYTFKTNSGNWISDGSGGWYCTYTNTSMNLGGGVEVYVLATSGDWVTLPLTAGNSSFVTQININGDEVQINFDNVDGTTSVLNPGNQSFKIITIPSI